MVAVSVETLPTSSPVALECSHLLAPPLPTFFYLVRKPLGYPLYIMDPLCYPSWVLPLLGMLEGQRPAAPHGACPGAPSLHGRELRHKL